MGLGKTAGQALAAPGDQLVGHTGGDSQDGGDALAVHVLDVGEPDGGPQRSGRLRKAASARAASGPLWGWRRATAGPDVRSYAWSAASL